MSALDHERDRLYRLVDEWIASRDDDSDENTPVRVDHVSIVGFVLSEDEDGDLVQGLWTHHESKSAVVQVGLLRLAALHVEEAYT